METDYALRSIGAESPDCNEDFAVVDANLGVFVVADGVGGRPAGDQASRLAGEAFVTALRNERTSHPFGPEPLARAMAKANNALWETGQSDPTLKGLSSTLTALVLSGGQARAVHVGDGRMYRFTNRELACLTTDHNMATELAETDAVKARGLQRWLSRALGFAAQVTADIVETPVQPGDIFVLATDGLGKSLTDASTLQVLERTSGRSAQDICDELIRAATAKPIDDDLTICVVKVVRSCGGQQRGDP